MKSITHFPTTHAHVDAHRLSRGERQQVAALMRVLGMSAASRFLRSTIPTLDRAVMGYPLRAATRSRFGDALAGAHVCRDGGVA